MDIDSFRPLSEGLGFHDKPEPQIQEQIEKIKPLEKEFTHYIPTTQVSNPKVKFPFPPQQTFHPATEVTSPTSATHTSEEAQGFNILSFIWDFLFISLCFSSFILAMNFGLGSQSVNALLATISPFEFLLTFTALYQIYVLFSRCYFGATLGEFQETLEWGTDKQKSSLGFSFMVILRVALNCVTGVVVFPLLNLILNHDILSKISGMKLYKSS